MFPFPPVAHSHWFEITALLALAAAGGIMVRWSRNSQRRPSFLFPFFWFWITWVLTLGFPTNYVVGRCWFDGLFIPVAWILGAIPIIQSLVRMRQSGRATGAWTVGILLVIWGFYQLLVWPVWMGARPVGLFVACRKNLELIAEKLLNGEKQTGRFPAPVTGMPPRSWRVDLLPHLGESGLRGRYREELVWDAAENLPLGEVRVSTFICPASEIPKDARNRWYTAYALPAGPDTLFPPGEPDQGSAATDDRSSTILIVEACGRRIVWTEPRDVDVTALPTGLNLPGAQPGESDGVFSSFHPGGAQAALADGSVWFLFHNIDSATLKQLLNARDSLPEKDRF